MNKSQKLLSFSVCLWKRSIHTASICFKGHSHWQNTRHIKAENDYLRSLKISQHVKLIRLAYLGLFFSNPDLFETPSQFNSHDG